MAVESEQRMSEDAGIIIPIDEVLARALAAESFITAYHDSVKFDQVEQRYKIYVDAYFFGQDNTRHSTLSQKSSIRNFWTVIKKLLQAARTAPL
jgi:hypothetical protein